MTGTTVRQATCVAIAGRAVLLEGPPGCGKSTLALKLIDRGATLVGDDGVALSLADGRVMAAPVETIRGLVEVRNVGVLEMPVCAAPVALVLRLASDAPRFVEQAESTRLLDQPVPQLWFDPEIPAAAIRAELALVRHGIVFDLHTAGKPAHN